MIAKDDTPVHFFEAIGCGHSGSEPVGIRIVAPQFGRRGPRIEADETALRTLDDTERAIGGVVEAIGGLE